MGDKMAAEMDIFKTSKLHGERRFSLDSAKGKKKNVESSHCPDRELRLAHVR
jgi:hypothetical protein